MKILKKVISLAILSIILSLSNTANSQENSAAYGVSVSGDDSKILSYDLPASLKPGEEYAASITFINTGKNPWSMNDNYLLSLFDQADNMYKSDVWGIQNIAVPEIVVPGEKAIILFKIKAPYEPGIYNSRWVMSKSNEYFGEYTLNVIEVKGESVPVNYNINPEGNDSRFLSISLPQKMTAGEKNKVSVTLQNSGIYPWNPAEGYKISPVVSSSDKLYPDWNSTDVSLSNVINENQTSEVEFYVTAPTVPGNYTLQWMMKKGDSYFGQISDKIDIIVLGDSKSEMAPGTNNSIYIKHQIPNSLTVNEEQDVTVTMANTGNKAWIKGYEKLVMVDGKMQIETVNPWGVGYVELPEDVQPGEVVTINFIVKPDETGWLHFQMMMMNNDGSVFGASTEPVEINVVPKR